MKKFLKTLFLVATLVVAFCAISKSQNYTITDLGETVKFRGANAYAVSNILKSHIVAISEVSSTEVKVTTTVGLPPYGRNEFTLDYSVWKRQSGLGFTSVSQFATYLTEVCNPRYGLNKVAYSIDSIVAADQVSFFSQTNDTVRVLPSMLIYKVSVVPATDTDTVKVKGRVYNWDGKASEEVAFTKENPFNLGLGIAPLDTLTFRNVGTVKYFITR